MKNLLVILGILVCIVEIYYYLRENWLSRLLDNKKKGERIRKPAVMRPKSELNCPFCVEEKGKRAQRIFCHVDSTLPNFIIKIRYLYHIYAIILLQTTNCGYTHY
jgi:hypothetical protein